MLLATLLAYSCVLCSAEPPAPARQPLDCRLASETVEAAISRKAASLDADEYCQYRRYENLADLDGDGQEDLVVLFTVEPRGGNDHRGFMAVFLSADPLGAEPLMVATGGRGDRDAVRISVRENRITLDTLEYLPGDPMCCPSGEGHLVYEFKAHSLNLIQQPKHKPARKKRHTGGA